MTVDQGVQSRLPPHNLEAEESLLGAMLMLPEAAAKALGIVSPADFYKPMHGHIFGAIASLVQRGDPIDAVTVTDELQRSNLLEAVGDPAVFVSLLANVPSIGHAGHYAGIVADRAHVTAALASGRR